MTMPPTGAEGVIRGQGIISGCGITGKDGRTVRQCGVMQDGENVEISTARINPSQLCGRR